MADVAHGQHVADDAVAVAVQAVNVGLDVIQDHLALQLGALVGVEADVVGVLVEAQSGHVQLAGGAVGGLAVEPDQGLLRVGDLGGGGAGSRGGLAGGRGAALGSGGAAAAGGQAQRHGSSQRQCKNLFHDNSPFPKVPQGSFVPCVLQSYLKALLTKKQGKKTRNRGQIFIQLV